MPGLREKSVTPQQLVDRCLAYPTAEETFPFGEHVAVMKVGGKMFALVGLNAEVASINLKCDPDLAVELRHQHSAVVPGYHMDKRHWNTVVIDGSVDLGLVDEWIEHSFELVVAGLTRKSRLALGLEGK